MRWTPLLICLLPSSAALALPSTPLKPLTHDGYRFAELPSPPALRRWEAGRTTRDGGCGRLPALPSPLAGELEVMPLVHDRFFNKFFQGGGRLYRLVSQQQGVPHAVVIRSGKWTLEGLAARLAREEGALRRQGQAYLLRMPLLLGQGASLVARPGESLRLSRERGAFIVSMGELHLRKARLEAWDEGRSAPAAPQSDPSAFRPFLLAWSGSSTYIGESTVAGLGFEENLASGLTMAAGPAGLSGYALPAAPQAMIHDSRFEGMHEGVLASAVPGLRLCRNQFEGSRQYALHLEAGTSGWVVGNRISGTEGPYALYASGVSDLKVVANEIVENRRSGIAISDSHDIVLAENQVRQNFDALFLQRTDEVLMTDNHLLDNQRHGVSLSQVGRVRMQGDHIGPNRGVGVLARPAGNEAPNAGAGTGKQQAVGEARQEPGESAAEPGKAVVVKASASTGSLRHPDAPALEADPATAKPARARLAPSHPRLELVNVALEGNHSSAMEVQRPYAVLMHRVDVLYPGVRRRPVFRGVLNSFESDMLDALPRSKTLQVSPVVTAKRRPGTR